MRTARIPLTVSNELHVYLDETGTFNQDDQRCAIGGFRSATAVGDADIHAFWQEVLGRVPEAFHSTDHDNDELGPLILRIIAEMQRRAWTPVIFEHLTRAWIVDNATTYACVMAEGLTRLGRMASPLQALHVHAAYRTVGNPENTDLHRMAREEYTARIGERLAIERVRSSAHASELRWTWTIDFASGTRDPRLWVADAICNSWRRVRRLPAEAQEMLRQFLAPHTISVLQSDDLERIHRLLGRQEYGRAVLDLLNLTIASPTDSALSTATQQVTDALANVGARTLETALSMPLFWIEQNIEAHNLPIADSGIAVMETIILDALQKKLPPRRREEIEPFRARALLLAMSSANHRGAVAVADAVLARLRPLRARLSRQVERLPLVIGSHFTESVHLTNAYDFEAAQATMLHLGKELDDVIKIFSTAGDHGPVRADAIGHALGAAVIATAQRARRDPALYREARQLSEQSFAQRVPDGERRRQHGTRCQLETDAASLPAAMHHLRGMLGLAPSTSMAEIATHALEADWFAVMHVARLWEAAARLGQADLAAEIGRAWTDAGLSGHPFWNRRERHPQGVILWKWGAALGYAGDATNALDRIAWALRHLEAEPGNVTSHTLALGARADALALRVAGDPRQYSAAREEFAIAYKKITDAAMPQSQRAWFAPWEDTLRDIRAERDVTRLQALWRRLAWDVPY